MSPNTDLYRHFGLTYFCAGQFLRCWRDGRLTEDSDLAVRRRTPRKKRDPAVLDGHLGSSTRRRSCKKKQPQSQQSTSKSTAQHRATHQDFQPPPAKLTCRRPALTVMASARPPCIAAPLAAQRDAALGANVAHEAFVCLN